MPASRQFFFTLVLAVAIHVAGCTDCRRGSATKDAGSAAGQLAAPAPTLRLAVITDLKGYLEPCGCTSDPMGGIDRMATKLSEARQDGVPLVTLLAGDSFYDEAELRTERASQEHQKAETLVEILDAVGVDAVQLGARDVAQGSSLEGLRKLAKFAWLQSEGTAVATAVVGEGRVKVGVIAAGPTVPKRDDVASAAAALRARSASLVVALVTGGRRVAQAAAAAEGVDFVAQGGLDQDEAVAPHAVRGTPILHASRQGQGLTIVDVYNDVKPGAFQDASAWSRDARRAELTMDAESLRERIGAWEQQGNINPADLAAQRKRLAGIEASLGELDNDEVPIGRWFSAMFVPLSKTTSERDESISARMLAYDKRVNAQNKVALADLKPVPLEPGQPGFVGSAECASCHGGAYDWWKRHKHGIAYRTLEELHKEFNLSCVGCHVTGYEKPGGSTVTHLLDGALENVGCENCHGPGGQHVDDPDKPMVRDAPETTCVQCHNEEHSDKFNYERYKATLRVPGHGLEYP